MRHSRRLAGSALVLCVVLAASRSVVAQQAVIVVRHAERLDDAEDSPLSPAGIARAERLAAMLKDARVSAVYATEWQRTRKTVEPLARSLGLDVTVVRSRDVDGLVARLRTAHPTGIVVVAAHSDTTPKILLAYGSPELVTIEHGEYDNLFVLVPRPAGPPALVRLRY